jgi:hypothetical protein
VGRVQEALLEPESRAFGAALKVLTDYDTDKPAQRLELSIEALSKMTDEELQAIVEGRDPARRRSHRE